MSTNRGSSRRGTGRNSPPRTYNKGRNSGWGRGIDRSGSRNNYSSGSDDSSDRYSGSYGESSDRNYTDPCEEPARRRYTPTVSSDSRRRRRRGGFDLANIDTRLVVILAIVVVVILGIVLAVNYVQTNGETFRQIGENITQVCSTILAMVIGAAVIWAIVVFSLFRRTGGRIKAILYVIILILLIMVKFNSTVAITLIVLLVLAAVLKYIIFR